MDDGDLWAYASALLRREWKRLHRSVAAVDAGGGPGSPRRGTARVAQGRQATALRVEAARPVLGKRAKRVVRAAKAVQPVLGEHHDSVVTRSVLRQLAVQAQLDGDSAFTFGLLYGLEERHAAALEDQLGQRGHLPKPRRTHRRAAAFGGSPTGCTYADPPSTQTGDPRFQGSADEGALTPGAEGNSVIDLCATSAGARPAERPSPARRKALVAGPQSDVKIERTTPCECLRMGRPGRSRARGTG